MRALRGLAPVSSNLPPEEQQAAYVEARKAWAIEINRPYPKRRKAERVRPEPGVIDDASSEEG